MAYAWRDAETQDERDRIYDEYGVCWSEFWRLDYWDPTRMLVIDAMHCVLEGIVHYHCRKVLRLDAKVAKKKRGDTPVAFEEEWLEYDADEVPVDFLLKRPDKEEAQVFKIQSKLCEALVPDGSTEPGINEAQMHKSLLNNNLPPLRFVAYSLGLDLSGEKTKADVVMRLMAWVSFLQSIVILRLI